MLPNLLNIDSTVKDVFTVNYRLEEYIIIAFDMHGISHSFQSTLQNLIF